MKDVFVWSNEIQLAWKCEEQLERNNKDIKNEEWGMLTKWQWQRFCTGSMLQDDLPQLLAEPCEKVSVWESYITFCTEDCQQDMCIPTMLDVVHGDIFYVM